MVRYIEKFDKAIYDTIKKGLTNNKFAKILKTNGKNYTNSSRKSTGKADK